MLKIFATLACVQLWTFISIPFLICSLASFYTFTEIQTLYIQIATIIWYIMAKDLLGVSTCGLITLSIFIDKKLQKGSFYYLKLFGCLLLLENYIIQYWDCFYLDYPIMMCKSLLM